MEQKVKMDKMRISKAVVSKIKKEGKPDAIFSNHIPGYESPKKINSDQENEMYTPDIVAIYHNRITVYQIESTHLFRSDKWSILARYAEKHNGNLYLVVPDYLKEYIKHEIEEKGINAGLISFKTS